MLLLATLTDARVEHFGEDFVASGDGDGVVGFELDVSAEAADQGYGLGLGDDSRCHSLKLVDILGLSVNIARSRGGP